MADAPTLQILPPAERERQRVDEAIVDMLRGYLARAEAGELGWVGLVALDASGGGEWSSTASKLDEHEIVGRIEQIKFRFLHKQQR